MKKLIEKITRKLINKNYDNYIIAKKIRNLDNEKEQELIETFEENLSDTEKEVFLYTKEEIQIAYNLIKNRINNNKKKEILKIGDYIINKTEFLYAFKEREKENNQYVYNINILLKSLDFVYTIKYGNEESRDLDFDKIQKQFM